MFFKSLFGKGTSEMSNTAPLDLTNSIIIDVRTLEEFNDGHLKGALNIDIFAADFKSQIERLDRNKNYLLYCRSGNRSGQAMHFMKQLGFKSAENLGSVSQASQITGVIVV